MPEPPDGRAPGAAASDRTLLRQASRAAMWNSVFLPVLAASNLAFSVLIRRRFGLFSGVYDIMLGLSAILLQYTAVGIPAGLSKFLPEVSSTSGPDGLKRFLRHAAAIRLLVLLAVLVPFNAFAGPLSGYLDLGPGGPLYIRLLSGLVIGRAVLDLVNRALGAFFANFWSNLFGVVQALLDIVLVGAVLLMGYGMGGVLGALAASAVAVAVVGTLYVSANLTRFSRESQESNKLATETAEADIAGALLAGHGPRFFRFSAFTFAVGSSRAFVGMGFAAPALAVMLSTEQVALFATAFKLALMTIGLVVTGFRGLYQPVFARLRLREDNRQLQRAFEIISKGQLLILLPAGLGLMVMSGDYIPLLFGQAFAPAVPLAWILVGFMYAETALNLSDIILAVHEEYRAALWIKSIMIVAAPVFLVAAAYGGLVAAAFVFGGARLIVAVGNYLVCRHKYEVVFPWAFAARVGLASAAMVVVLVAARAVWSTSPLEAVTLTGVGVAVFGVTLRWVNAIGADEIDILERTRLPGHRLAVAWFSSRGSLDSSV